MNRHKDTQKLRRRLGTMFLLGSAALLGASVLCESALLTACLAAGSCLLLLSQQPNWWSSVVQVSGRHVGSLFGLMNGMGAFGAIATQLFFGYFSDWRAAAGHTGRNMYDPAYIVYISILIVGAALWQVIDTSRPVGEHSEASRARSA